MDVDFASRTVIYIAEWRVTWVNSLFGLFSHSFNHFFAQIIYVVFRRNYLDPVHEFRLRFGVFRKNTAGFRKMDFYVESVQEHGIIEISIKAVRLFDENDSAAFRTFKKIRHFPEGFSSGGFRRFYVDKFMDDFEIVFGSVRMQHF